MIDTSRPVQLRNGWPARFIGTADGPKPLLFAYRNPRYPDREDIIRIDEKGNFLSRDSDFDVINAPEERTFVVLTHFCDTGRGLFGCTFMDSDEAADERIKSWPRQVSLVSRETKTFVKTDKGWQPKV